jgi:hypothetical protein
LSEPKCHGAHHDAGVLAKDVLAGDRGIRGRTGDPTSPLTRRFGWTWVGTNHSAHIEGTDIRGARRQYRDTISKQHVLTFEDDFKIGDRVSGGLPDDCRPIDQLPDRHGHRTLRNPLIWSKEHIAARDGLCQRTAEDPYRKVGRIAVLDIEPGTPD